MSMVVKNNMGAVSVLNTLNKNSTKLQDSLSKVSSGLKINSAKDDSSGYAISERMRVQIRALDQDVQNTQNAASLMKVAEGGVTSTLEILKTMKEKAINAATDTNTEEDRKIIQKEIDQFIDQINDNALITFNGKYLLEGSTSVTSALSGSVPNDARAAIIKGLNSEWVKQSLALVDASFGLGFDPAEGANPGVREITVKFEDDETSTTLAYVTNWSTSGSKANKLELTVNMHYYNDIDMDDENGSSSSSGASYLDRTLAHEFTHAAMAANIANFNDLPKWFKEGSAEIVHGVDDTRAGSMVELLQNPTTLEAVLNGTNDDKDYAYAAGYMILRYMAKEGAATGGTNDTPLKVMQSLMSELASNGQSGFDNAIKTASNDKFSSESDLKTKFMALVRNPTIDTTTYDLSDETYTDISIPNSITWKTDGVFAFMKAAFGIDMVYHSNINEKDTGAITGSDAGGSEDLNAEDIVPEETSPDEWKLPTESSTTFSGLTVIWPDGYVTEIDEDGATSYDNVKILEKKLTIQIGAKSNESINIGFLICEPKLSA